MSQEHTQSLPGNSPVSGLPPTQPLWTDSAVLGGYFVYAPSTDEIYLRDGRRFPRPANLPRSALAIATYTGRLPPPSAGLPQHPLPVTGSPPTPIQMPMHPGSPQNPVSAMGSMRTYRGQIQEINAQKPVEVVFHHGSTQSQIMRREPPNIHARGVNIGKPEITSTLFKEYRVRSNPKQFFQVGTVFLVLWSEPAGGTSLVSKWAAGTVINHLGERVFSRVRRFVVIREGGNYCNALPINTYAGRGVAKPGVNKSEHAIIFTGRSPPLPGSQELPRRGEIGMRPVSIQVDPDSLDERLDPMSRLDLGGVTKVEHNIKVKSLGRVNRRSLDALRTQYAMVQGYLGGARDSSLPQHALHSSLRKFSDGFETRKVEGEGGKEVEDEDDEEDEEEDDEEDEDDDGDDESDDDDDGGSDDGTETPTSALVERNILAAAEPLTHISAARSKTRDSLSGSDRSENNKAQAESDKTGDDDMER